MEDKYKAFCEITKTLAIDLIENAKQHPAEIRDRLQYVVTDIIDDYLMSKNWKVEFDSPMGEDAAGILTEMGLVAEWDGEQYHRGTTTIYFPKDKVSKEDAESIDKIISILSTLTNDDELNDLFDEDTTITLMNKEEE